MTNSYRKRIILITSLIIATAIAIGLLIYFLVIIPKNQEKELLMKVEEYYNNKISLFAEENKTIENAEVVFIGDSLTDGCDLKKYYPNFNTINRGIGGDTTFGLEKRLQVSLFDINPKVVVMLIGGNNLNTMFDNYESILIKLKENLPNSYVILVSLSAMGKELKNKNEIAVNNNIKIKTLADKYFYSYVDIFTPLYNQSAGEIYSEYTTDGAHFTDAGYKVVAAEITTALYGYIN